MKKVNFLKMWILHGSRPGNMVVLCWYDVILLHRLPWFIKNLWTNLWISHLYHYQKYCVLYIHVKRDIKHASKSGLRISIKDCCNFERISGLAFSIFTGDQTFLQWTNKRVIVSIITNPRAWSKTMGIAIVVYYKKEVKD